LVLSTCVCQRIRKRNYILQLEWTEYKPEEYIGQSGINKEFNQLNSLMPEKALLLATLQLNIMSFYHLTLLPVALRYCFQLSQLNGECVSTVVVY
jgi:hypothetical protein